MTNPSIVIITPRLCAILSINIFYTLLVLSTDQKQTFCAHAFISWNPVLTAAFHSEDGTIPSVPPQLE